MSRDVRAGAAGRTRTPLEVMLIAPLLLYLALFVVYPTGYAVQRRLGVTTLYVTHGQTEAMPLGDRVVVMHAGCMQQLDTPLAVYERPGNTFVAGFVGTPPMNLLPGRYAGGELAVANQRVSLPPAVRDHLGAGPLALTVGIRPEAFVRTSDTSNALLAVPDRATVEVLGSETLVRATIGSDEVTVRLFGVARDIPERVAAAAETLHLFAADTGQRVAPECVTRSNG